MLKIGSLARQHLC